MSVIDFDDRILATDTLYKHDATTNGDGRRSELGVVETKVVITFHATIMMVNVN